MSNHTDRPRVTVAEQWQMASEALEAARRQDAYWHRMLYRCSGPANDPAYPYFAVDELHGVVYGSYIVVGGDESQVTGADREWCASVASDTLAALAAHGESVFTV